MTKIPSSSKRNQRIRIRTESQSSRSSLSPRSIDRRKRRSEKRKRPNEFVMQSICRQQQRKIKRAQTATDWLKKGRGHHWGNEPPLRTRPWTLPEKATGLQETHLLIVALQTTQKCTYLWFRSTSAKNSYSLMACRCSKNGWARFRWKGEVKWLSPVWPYARAFFRFCYFWMPKAITSSNRKNCSA